MSVADQNKDGSENKTVLVVLGRGLGITGQGKEGYLLVCGGCSIM